MSQEFLNKKRVQFGTVGTPLALDAATDITSGGFAPVVPVDVYRVGVIVTTAYTPPASGALTITLSKASPVNAAPTSFVVLSFGTTDYDIGDVIWADVIATVAQTSGDDTLTGGTTPQTSLLDVAPAGPMSVDPGDAVEMTVTNTAVAGDGIIVLEFVEKDEARRFPNDGVVFVNP